MITVIEKLKLEEWGAIWTIVGAIAGILCAYLTYLALRAARVQKVNEDPTILHEATRTNSKLNKALNTAMTGVGIFDGLAMGDSMLHNSGHLHGATTGDHATAAGADVHTGPADTGYTPFDGMPDPAAGADVASSFDPSIVDDILNAMPT